MKNKKWKSIWNQNAKRKKSKNLQDLLSLNGHFSPTSNINVNDWNNYINHFVQKYNITKKDNILEIGCGAGAFLFPFFKKKINCYGVDFSKELIKHCKKFLNPSNFYVREVNNLKILKKRNYSYIFANSIFQYFPSEFYAKKVLNEILSLANPKTKIFLLDIPNKIKYNKWKRSVIQNIGKQNFNLKYNQVKHRFYNKEFFINYCKIKKYKIKFSPQNLIKKENSKFRFNIFITK